MNGKNNTLRCSLEGQQGGIHIELERESGRYGRGQGPGAKVTAATGDTPQRRNTGRTPCGETRRSCRCRSQSRTSPRSLLCQFAPQPPRARQAGSWRGRRGQGAGGVAGGGQPQRGAGEWWACRGGWCGAPCGRASVGAAAGVGPHGGVGAAGKVGCRQPEATCARAGHGDVRAVRFPVLSRLLFCHPKYSQPGSRSSGSTGSRSADILEVLHLHFFYGFFSLSLPCPFQFHFHLSVTTHNTWNL